MSQNKVISWSEWESTYKPQQQDIVDFIDELLEKSDSPYHIWTVVDNNPNSVYLDIVPGYHIFNRLGFFTTEVPWSDKELTVSNDPSYQE